MMPVAVGRVSDDDDESDIVWNELVVVRGSLDDVLEPAEKKLSSEMSDKGRALAFPVGGGVTRTSPLSLGPLDTVTGDPSPKITPPTRLRPNPSPGFAFLARLTAEANSSSRSVRELVRRNELLRLGAMTRGSPG